MTAPSEKKSAWNIELGTVSATDVLFMTRHLSIALKNGLTLLDGLEMLLDQATGVKFQRMLETILELIRSGRSFHEALALYPRQFSPFYVHLVRTGELAGTLQENLAHLASHLLKTRELRQKVRSAMMYPLLILIAILSLAFSVTVFVLPKILPLFKALDLQLPLTTRILIRVSEVFQAHGLVIFIASIVALFFLSWFLTRKFVQPFLHPFLLSLPVVGRILKSIHIERLSRTLSILIHGGIPLDRALFITGEATESVPYRDALFACLTEIQKGNTLASAINYFPRLFPKITSRMVGMGEKTGSLDSTLHSLSEMYTEEIEMAMKNFSTLIEPFLLILMGLVVGGVALSILSPIYQITGGIRH